VSARPEVETAASLGGGGEGGKVGGAHGLDALVDDAEGVVGPEVAARVGEVAVFEEELVAEADVEHEMVLGEHGLLLVGGDEEKEREKGTLPEA
jgi:hypothetical protein